MAFDSGTIKLRLGKGEKVVQVITKLANKIGGKEKKKKEKKAIKGAGIQSSSSLVAYFDFENIKRR